jgi:hypothetical protein
MARIAIETQSHLGFACAVRTHFIFTFLSLSGRSISDILVQGTCNLVLLYPIPPCLSHNASTHKVQEKEAN